MIGQEISHYRVLERLGGGGMGEVFKAEDLRLGRSVALKFLPPELGRDPVAKERFLQEARAASALDHPHICTVHDIGETEDGRLFLAMAFYDGETLKQRLAAGALPVDEALGIAEQVAEGLAEAHGRGIVHRDVKPANLMLTRDGTVKIVDFGLAKLVAAPGLTRTGMYVGTPAYMSPEQTRGGDVDHRTDLWSLGVVLYEMLAGRRPFTGASEGEILHAILYEKPGALGALRAGVPPAVERLVEDLLAGESGRRPATARDALERIRATRKEAAGLNDAPTLTRPGVGKQEPPPGTAFGVRRVALGGALVVGAVVAALAAFLWVDRAREAGETPVPAEGELAPSPLPGRKMIVVLPFENLGPPEHEYFAAGITEELTSRLAVVHGLGVISRNTAVHYPAAGKAMQEIGEDLGVGYVLEGTVRWAPAEGGPGRVRITPQLIRVADDTHLWADAYDATLEDVFRVQAEIAERVVGELQVTLLASERETIERRPTESPEAYDAYLRGLYHRGKNVALEVHVWGAVEALEDAVRLDPEFVLAWAELATAHGVLHSMRYDRSEERAEASRRAAERALELDPGSPHAHLALGSYYYHVHRDYERALGEYEIARDGLPSSGEVRAQTAYALRRQGRWDDSVAMLQEATALDPRNVEYWSQLQNCYLAMRRYRDAIDVGHRMVALDPESSAPGVGWYFLGETGRALEWWERWTADELHRVSAFSELDYLEGEYAEALERLAAYAGDDLHLLMNFHAPKELRVGALRRLMGDEEGARSAYERAREILERQVEERPEDPLPHSALGLAYAGLGQAREAIQHGRLATELTPVSDDALEGPLYLIALARIYAMVGEVEAALDTLEELFSIPAQISIPLVEIDPVFDPLRDHPRYARLIERYGTDQPVDP